MDRVRTVSSAEPAAVSAAVHIRAEHPAFAGHFPGSPLLPGVSLLAEVIELALREPACVEAIGPRPRIAVAKFLSPVRPGDTIDIRLRGADGRLIFECLRGTQLAATGQFDPPTRSTCPPPR